MFALTLGTFAQAPQLSLADLLIGLRSKKATLMDRNKILTEAVQQRGITFLLSAEIEKELATTGANADLLAAVRAKSAEMRAALAPKPTPIPTPTPPDFSFFKARADANAVKGEFTTALVDYNKSIDLKKDSAGLYFSRGRAHYNMKAYGLAVDDFSKALELDPKDANVYFNRGLSLEKLGDQEKAAADFEKAAEFDPADEQIKANLNRLKDALAKAAELARPKPEPIVPPEFISRGTLTTGDAVKLVTPIYSTTAQRANIEGKVTVEVELDAEGNVVSAEAKDGHRMLRSAAEAAAERSKFLPAMFDNRPIKSKGVIVYNFSLKD